MSDEPTQHIAVPDGWGDMTDDEKNAYVNDALVKIASDAGVDVDSPGDADETFDAPADDTEAPAESEAAPRVFREPGQ